MTGQSHFMLIFWLSQVTLRGQINSVKWPPSHAGECAPPPTNGGGTHSPAVEGVPIWTTGEKTWQWTLCCVQKKHKIRQMNATVQCTQKPLKSDFAESNQLHTLNVRDHINSAKSLYTVTTTPYHECTQLVQKILLLNSVHSLYGVGVTAYIHGTDLMWLRKVTLQSTKISIKWLWPVKVTLKVIKRRLKVFGWSCEEGPLK